jgi:serine phosphatase RsbU (regulator of sigma subunit)
MSAFVCFYGVGGALDHVYREGNLCAPAVAATFFELFEPASMQKAFSFWEAVNRSGFACDWTMRFANGTDKGDGQRMRIFAVALNEQVVVIAIEEHGETLNVPSDGQTLEELSAIVNEISVAHRQAAKSAARMQLAMQAEQLGRKNAEELQERLRFLAKAAHQCAQSTVDVQQFIGTVLALAVPSLGDLCVITAKFAERKRSRGTHSNPDSATRLDAVLRRRSFDLDELAEFCSDSFVMPLGTRIRHEASMYVGCAAGKISEDMRILARQFADIVSVALDNALLYEEQRSVSEELQRALLPTALPSSTYFELDAIYKPSGGGPDYMGGDWYDAFMLPDGALAISIGDVTGHGVYAAVAMGKARQAIRTSALNEIDPARVLMSASRLLFFEHIIATALYGRLDLKTFTFIYAIAGHPPPMLATADDAILLSYGGTPLGLDEFENAGPALFDVALKQGMSLLFYTDGLVEQDLDITLGLAQLVRVVRELSRSDFLGLGTPQKVLRKIIGDSVAADDIAVLCLHMVPEGETTCSLH